MHFDTWLKASLIILPLIVGTFTAIGYVNDGEISTFAIIGVLVSAAVTWPIAFASHWVEINGKEIRLRWAPIYKTSINRASITDWSVSDEAVSPWKYGGIGLRLASGGTLALVNRKGRILKLETSENRRYAITLANDKEVAAVSRELSLQNHS